MSDDSLLLTWLLGGMAIATFINIFITLFPNSVEDEWDARVFGSLFVGGFWPLTIVLMAFYAVGWVITYWAPLKVQGWWRRRSEKVDKILTKSFREVINDPYRSSPPEQCQACGFLRPTVLFVDSRRPFQS